MTEKGRENDDRTEVEYVFEQRFRVPARFAYEWSTDYTPEDLQISGQSGTRRIERLSEKAVILTDTRPGDDGKAVAKSRLVHLYPETLSWTNTHVSGPRQHSQFLYTVRPDGPDASILRFQGRELVPMAPKGSPAFVQERAATLSRDDSALWKVLAGAMEKDYAARPRRT
jgi:hypothetical protein